MTQLVDQTQFTDTLKKYIPQCDKQHHIMLRFGSIVESEHGIIQKPFDNASIAPLQSLLQSNKSYKKSQVSGWRVYAGGLIYDQNKRTGEVVKQHRVIEHTSSTKSIVLEYVKIEEDISTVASLTLPNMEEEYERIIYTCGESGLNELEWCIEHSNLSKHTSITCLLKKPVQYNKLWKHFQGLCLTDN